MDPTGSTLATAGNLLVLVALFLASAGTITGVVAGMRRSGEALWWTRMLAIGFGLTTFLANLVMVRALIVHDFRVSYVAQIGSVDTPLYFTIASLWASLSGSILLWAGVLGIYTTGLVLAMGQRHREYMAWTLAVLLSICVFFALLVTSVANPFEPTDAMTLAGMCATYGCDPSGMPLNGPGPNPLLQNHWLMTVHPPTLYMGYVGMAVPFSMCCAALLAGRMEAGWIVPIRRTFLVPWAFLTAGIVLGGWWSYAVLGWGGYWAWDPVENASFMPWLLGTAFLHSALVMGRRGDLKTWTLILGMMTFIATLFGTFLTRSGVFNSVHAFAEGDVGQIFLAYIGIVLVFSVSLVALREHTLHETALPRLGASGLRGGDAPESMRMGLRLLIVLPPTVGITLAVYKALPLTEPFAVPQWAAFFCLVLVLPLMRVRLLSRDVAILLQNLAFSLFTFVVFLGTVYPIMSDWLRDKKVSVGEPFFDQFALPIGVAIVWLMGVGPVLPWGQADPRKAITRFAVPFAGGLLLALWGVLVEFSLPGTLLALFVVGFALVANLGEVIEPAMARARAKSENPVIALGHTIRKGRRRFGGHVAHFGVVMAVFVMAIAEGYKDESFRNYTEVGQVEDFGGYQVRFEGVEVEQLAHMQATKVEFSLLQDGVVLQTLHPAVNLYPRRADPLPAPDTRTTATHDLQLSVMEARSDGSFVSLRLIRMPYMLWLWVAPAIIALGALMSILPARRRRERTP